MLLRIKDDFDLKKIQISGQCFRVKETEPGVFRFITGENVVYIREVKNSGEASQIKDAGKAEAESVGGTKDAGEVSKVKDRGKAEAEVVGGTKDAGEVSQAKDVGKAEAEVVGDFKDVAGGGAAKVFTDSEGTEAGSKCFEVSCSMEEWKRVWEPYFDMGRNYSEICEKEYGRNDFTDRAIDCGRGLRILKQDKWEMLVSFIISQRKSIPAISSAVEAVSRKFGTRIDTAGLELEFANDERSIGDKDNAKSPDKSDDSVIYAFPTPEQMACASLDDLKACGLGYRAPYVLDAIHKVLGGELDLDAIDKLDDEGLFEKLMEVHGVGMKVSNCVCLFAYSRMGRAPVDVWIARAIDEHYGGVNPFPEYGENAGIIQQYIFYYMKNN